MAEMHRPEWNAQLLTTARYFAGKREAEGQRVARVRVHFMEEETPPTPGPGKLEDRILLEFSPKE